MNRCWLVGAGISLLAGCSTVPAETSVRKDSWQWNLPDDPFTCPSGSIKRVVAQTYGELRTQLKDPQRPWSKESPGDYVPARLDYLPAMRYPQEMRGDFKSGFVLMLVNIDDAGRVVDSKVACSTDPRFEAVAVQAAGSSRYRPSTLNGNPVPDFAMQPFSFSP
jgi:TonB family protein